MTLVSICDGLISGQQIESDDFLKLLSADKSVYDELSAEARKKRDNVYGNSVFLRGLIEITSYCQNDCYYCGLRCSNSKAERYRLNKDVIMDCCEDGYGLGFRTFVLQGGEDAYFSDERLAEIVGKIKSVYNDCAVTLSLGERSPESYKLLKKAGADRYLLRHETATESHYRQLHPQCMSFDNRMSCLRNLRENHYQTGCGFMVGSPFQTGECIVKELEFIRDFKPEMVGIGPFIPHKNTPFGRYTAGSIEMTLKLITIIRLLLPSVLLPATTALATLSDEGIINGLNAGANVIMPNLTPAFERKKYMIYDNKKTDGAESAENMVDILSVVHKAGMTVSLSRGDFMETKV